jgi:hypothetical protein
MRDEAEAHALLALMLINHARHGRPFPRRRARPARRPGPVAMGPASDRERRGAARTRARPPRETNRSSPRRPILETPALLRDRQRGTAGCLQGRCSGDRAVMPVTAVCDLIRIVPMMNIWSLLSETTPGRSEGRLSRPCGTRVILRRGWDRPHSRRQRVRLFSGSRPIGVVIPKHPHAATGR